MRKVGNTLQEDITASHFVTVGENEKIVIEGVQSIEVKTALRTLTLETLLIPIEQLNQHDMWPAFQRLAELRGGVDSQDVLHILTLYEADACEYFGLPRSSAKS